MKHNLKNKTQREVPNHNEKYKNTFWSTKYNMKYQKTHQKVQTFDYHNKEAIISNFLGTCLQGHVSA